jgi:hypothetical protein
MIIGCKEVAKWAKEEGGEEVGEMLSDDPEAYTN